ncbi:MAG TPA: M1 family metallopeptidase [Pyrinomonadaceae bacterium]|jgi:aminopeptidase N|nr:M1 family metallopeptidase [Pyrinomonadaceae bacterium]
MCKRVALIVSLLLLIFVAHSSAQRTFTERALGSGGPLMPEQAAYDVKSYDLSVKVNIEEKSIEGVLTVKAAIVKPLDKFVLDLHDTFIVDSVKSGNAALTFKRTDKQIWIDLPRHMTPGQAANITVVYHGVPRSAPHPPWVGGFVWSKSKDGSPWFATAVQNDGADIWFPCKDHPSDKPETASLHFTVPKTLVAASNGKLQSIKENSDGTSTYNWFVSQPIANYCIALNVGPYKLIKDTVPTVAGGTIPVWFYVLPEDADKAPALLDQLKKFNAFFESYLGPYPFRADKIGIAETPHLGMEHQSITAYGNGFKNNSDGFDGLLEHEFGHEWFANLITGKDWADMWLQEGFQSFMDTLYVEKLKGKDAYFAEMSGRQRGFHNVRAVAPREATSTLQIYFLAPDYVKSDGDIYGKGAYTLSTMRFYLGDDMFFKMLRRWTYSTPEMEKVTNGEQEKIVTTDDFLAHVNKFTGKDMTWFFNIYLRQPKLPKLIAEASGNKLNLRWETPDKLPFPMPVEVEMGGEIKRVEMPDGKGSIEIPKDTEYIVDPHRWVLKEQ